MYIRGNRKAGLRTLCAIRPFASRVVTELGGITSCGKVAISRPAREKRACSQSGEDVDGYEDHLDDDDLPDDFSVTFFFPFSPVFHPLGQLSHAALPTHFAPPTFARSSSGEILFHIKFQLLRSTPFADPSTK